MGQQLLAAAGARIVFAGVEVNILAVGEGLGLNLAGFLGRFVDAHAAEVGTKARLHERPHIVGEGLAAAFVLAEALLEVRRSAGLVAFRLDVGLELGKGVVFIRLSVGLQGLGLQLGGSLDGLGLFVGF